MSPSAHHKVAHHHACGRPQYHHTDPTHPMDHQRDRTASIARTAILALAIAAAMLVASTPLRGSESDDTIESSIRKTYVYRTYLKDDAVTAKVQDGVVTLTGQVSEVSHRFLAQLAVLGLAGVEKVDNRLQVTMEGDDKSDPWVKAKVRSVLVMHRNVGDSSTQVDIKDGVITLRGVATSEAQRALATAYAEDVQGVLRVINVMTLSPTPAEAERTPGEKMDDASVTALVKTALLIHRSTCSVNTKIETRDGEVTLTGIAKNAAEKALVTKLVTDIVGVTGVKNGMTLEEPQAK